MLFDPIKYYESYPSRVILRPGYPARAQYKSTLMWDLYGQQIVNSLREINTYADIGGCFGFGANSMAFQISMSQGKYPQTNVFEISTDFITIGKQLFPYIEFIQKNFIEWKGEHFDLITMFDVIEHIPNPESFLLEASRHARFALLMTPMETEGDLFGAKPPVKQGNEHEDGHVNFFTPRSYLRLLNESGWELVDGKLIRSIAKFNNGRCLMPEVPPIAKSLIRRIIPIGPLLPFFISRMIFGHGKYICIVKSKQISDNNL